MLIFQVNDDKNMSQEEYDRWNNYLEAQYEKKSIILLPPNIDLIKNYSEDEEE